MNQLRSRARSTIALVYIAGMVIALAAGASIRLIFVEAPIADLLLAIITLFAVPIGVVIAGQREDPASAYLQPAVLFLSIAWTSAIVGVIFIFEVQAIPFRNQPAACTCSLSDVVSVLSKQFPKANALLSLVLGAMFASGGKHANDTTPPASGS